MQDKIAHGFGSGTGTRPYPVKNPIKAPKPEIFYGFVYGKQLFS
jgi:hypothetical protein